MEGLYDFVVVVVVRLLCVVYIGVVICSRGGGEVLKHLMSKIRIEKLEKKLSRAVIKVGDNSSRTYDTVLQILPLCHYATST